YYSHPRQEPEILDQVLQTGVALLGRRTVHRRSTPDTRGDVTVFQLQPVLPIPGNRLIAKPGPIECAIKPVAGSVPRESTAGPVASVSCGSQAADEQARPRVSEPGYGPAPVFLVAERGAFFARYLFPPGDQPWAGTARNDPFVMNLKGRSHTQWYQAENSCKTAAAYRK